MGPSWRGWVQILEGEVATGHSRKDGIESLLHLSPGMLFKYICLPKGQYTPALFPVYIRLLEYWSTSFLVPICGGDNYFMLFTGRNITSQIGKLIEALLEEDLNAS